jgi:serine/threonine protein kinase
MARHIDGQYQHTASNVGPLRHMAPEQLVATRYSRESDVWAFGVVLYETFSGHAPWLDVPPAVAAHKVIIIIIIIIVVVVVVVVVVVCKTVIVGDERRAARGGSRALADADLRPDAVVLADRSDAPSHNQRDLSNTQTTLMKRFR